MATKPKRTVSDLSPNPGNPRKIKDDRLVALKAALAEFGDLGGVVYNRRTSQLVGGHQRTKLFNPSSEVTIERTYAKPTGTGTVAEGFIVSSKGERFAYREVEWDEIKEKAANIAANKGAGEWDLPQLSDWLREIDSFGFDLDLTMFGLEERSDLMVPTLNPNFDPGSEDEQGKLDSIDPVMVDCPHCGERFDSRNAVVKN